MCQARTAERDEFRLRDGGIRLERNKGFGHFAPLFVGNRNHARLQDRRMGEDGLLKFRRGDVLSSAYDDVFLTIDDKQVAFFVDRGHVSRVEPTATQRFGRSAWLPP